MKLSPYIFFFVVIYAAQCIQAQYNGRNSNQCPPCPPCLEQPNNRYSNFSTSPPHVAPINLNDHGDVIEICHKTYLVNRDHSKLTWEQADKKCESLNMKLLSLQSREKQNCLNNFFADFNGQSYEFWTSGKDLYGSRVFQWTTTNEPITFQSWAHNQPDNRNGNQQCIVVKLKDINANNAATWSDEKCQSKFRFICE